MAEPFLTEIRICSFNFPPKGWALANGQFLPINQNQAMFALLGTTYGGNGQTTFALPNLRGRVPVGEGAGHTLGEAAGSTAVTVTYGTMPSHDHFITTTQNAATSATPAGNTWAVAGAATYGTQDADSNPAAMDTGLISATGGSQPHNNMAPVLVLNFIIALQGIFPSQT